MAAPINQAYTHPLRDMQFSDLSAYARGIQRITHTPEWDLLMRCIDAHAEKLNEQLLNPHLPRIEKVAALTAEIRGLKATRAAADTIIAYAEAREAEENAREPEHV